MFSLSISQSGSLELCVVSRLLDIPGFLEFPRDKTGHSHHQPTSSKTLNTLFRDYATSGSHGMQGPLPSRTNICQGLGVPVKSGDLICKRSIAPVWLRLTCEEGDLHV